MAKKYVSYELDKARNIRLGMVAMNNIKNKLGKTINELDFENKVDTYEIATVLWSGMVHEDNTLTVERVMELIDEHSNIMEAINKMTETMTEAFGSPNEPRIAEEKA